MVKLAILQKQNEYYWHFNFIVKIDIIIDNMTKVQHNGKYHSHFWAAVMTVSRALPVLAVGFVYLSLIYPLSPTSYLDFQIDREITEDIMSFLRIR